MARRVWAAILWGGLAAVVLYRVSLVVVYQSVASGLLGREAYKGGLATAALGLALHFLIATAAAAVYVGASHGLPVLRRQVMAGGLAFGVAVYFFMKYLVLPLSAVARLTPFEPLAMIGHALLVGLPISLVARQGLSPRSPGA
jgi:hypothetical protein